MKLFIEILKGMVIGLANIIPGVSGGTMMVAMGIYDNLIYSITHLFKEFKKAVRTLFPYAVGMVVAIATLSFALKWAFAEFPLPTNTLFIGLILGGLPAILKQVKGEKTGWFGAILFAVFFAIVLLLQIFQKENSAVIQLSFLEVIKLFLLGGLASATMVIPGVSGSMILKLLGYYEPVVTQALPAFISGVLSGDWTAALYNAGILIPFGVGIIIGIFAIAKLIEVLMARWKGLTYMAIIGMVVASPVSILLGTDMSGATWLIILASIVTFALGYVVAWKLGGEEK